MRLNGSEASIYINGVAGSSVATDWHHVAVTDSTGIDASAMEIGRAAADYFHGVIDDIRIYDRVLSPEEIYLLSGNATCN